MVNGHFWQDLVLRGPVQNGTAPVLLSDSSSTTIPRLHSCLPFPFLDGYRKCLPCLITFVQSFPLVFFFLLPELRKTSPYFYFKKRQLRAGGLRQQVLNRIPGRRALWSCSQKPKLTAGLAGVPSRLSPAGLGVAAAGAPGALQLQVGGAGGGERGREAEAEAVHQPPQQRVPAALGRRQPHVVAQLLGRHLQVARVPEHPPDEAEEDADAARVDEQVGEEHVGEHAGQQHRQPQRVEGQRQPEGGHAAAQPARGRHGGAAPPPPRAARTWGEARAAPTWGQGRAAPSHPRAGAGHAPAPEGTPRPRPPHLRAGPGAAPLPPQLRREGGHTPPSPAPPSPGPPRWEWKARPTAFGRWGLSGSSARCRSRARLSRTRLGPLRCTRATSGTLEGRHLDGPQLNIHFVDLHTCKGRPLPAGSRDLQDSYNVHLQMHIDSFNCAWGGLKRAAGIQVQVDKQETSCQCRM